MKVTLKSSQLSYELLEQIALQVRSAKEPLKAASNK
jgi:hypothetical protein